MCPFTHLIGCSLCVGHIWCSVIRFPLFISPLLQTACSLCQWATPTLHQTHALVMTSLSMLGQPLSQCWYHWRNDKFNDRLKSCIFGLSKQCDLVHQDHRTLMLSSRHTALRKRDLMTKSQNKTWMWRNEWHFSSSFCLFVCARAWMRCTCSSAELQVTITSPPCWWKLKMEVQRNWSLYGCPTRCFRLKRTHAEHNKTTGSLPRVCPE